MTNPARGRSLPARLVLLALATVAALGILAAPALAAEITLTADGFDPPTVEVTPNETVVWLNDTEEEVTIVGADGSWDSGPLAPGETFSLSLSEPGTYEYRTSGDAREGSVIVAAAAQPTEAPSPAATADPMQAPPDDATLPATGQVTVPVALLAVVLIAGGTVLVRATRLS